MISKILPQKKTSVFVYLTESWCDDVSKASPSGYSLHGSAHQFAWLVWQRLLHNMPLLTRPLNLHWLGDWHKGDPMGQPHRGCTFGVTWLVIQPETSISWWTLFLYGQTLRPSFFINFNVLVNEMFNLQCFISGQIVSYRDFYFTFICHYTKINFCILTLHVPSRLFSYVTQRQDQHKLISRKRSQGQSSGMSRNLSNTWKYSTRLDWDLWRLKANSTSWILQRVPQTHSVASLLCDWETF